jgi:hypothetical protein
MLVAALIRCLDLEAAQISSDEAFSWKVTRGSLPVMLGQLAGDVHPPLYYLVLKAWCFAFGDSLASMRILSGLLSCSTVWGIWLFVQQLGSAMAGSDSAEPVLFSAAHIAAWLYTLSPTHTAQARVARMYSLGVVLTVFSSWFLLRLVASSKGRLRYWTGYVLTAAALAYTHYYGMFTVTGQLLFLIVWRWRSASALRWAPPLWLSMGVTPAAIATFLVPWLPSLLSQVHSVQQGYWIPQLSLGSLGSLLGWFVTEAHHTGLLGAAACLFWTVFLLATLAQWTSDSRRLLGSLIVLPWLGGLAASIATGTPVILDRYLVFAHVSYLAALAMAIHTVRPALIRLLILAIVLCNYTYGHVQQLQAVRSQDQGLPAAVRVLAQKMRVGELVIVGNARIANQVLYYFHRLQASGTVKVVGQPVRDGPHQVHAASIAENEWVDPDDLTAQPSGAVWHLGVSRRDFEYPKHWLVEQCQEFREPTGQRLFLVQFYQQANTKSQAPSSKQTPSSKHRGAMRFRCIAFRVF